MQQRLNEGEAFLFGPFRLLASERLLLKEGEPVPLGGRALDILIALIERAGEVVSHRELFKRVWSDVIVDEASLRVQIAGLRKTLGDGREGARYIANVPAKGYCFVAPVQRSQQLQPSPRAVFDRTRSDTLPDPLRRMVGRDDTVELLCSDVRSGRFVTIVGPGGVGKTTVAVAVAHALASDFQEAVCFVDLSVLRDGALLVTAIASAMGCVAQTQDSSQRLLGFLSDKRILIVLDSCEHVLDPVAQFAENLCREAPRVHLIATSREALRAEGENIFPLQSLELPTGNSSLTATKALGFPAVQLFMDRAAAGGVRHELTDDEANHVVDICRQLDGMPLAIELVASRVSAYGISGLTRLVGDHLMLVWRTRRGVPRHQTLQSMLDWSYELLSDGERTTLAALSVFVGAFTLEMAQAVLSRHDRDGLQVANEIVSLMDKSLIAVSPTEDAIWYRLLDTTRSYAALKARELGEDKVVARRHALYFAERLGRVRTAGVRGRDWAGYNRHIGDIRAALEWSFSASGDASVGVALSAGAMGLFLALSMLSECRRWSLQAIHALAEEDRGTKLELELQLSLAISSNHAHSDGSEVGTVLERALELADSLRDPEYQLEVLAGLNLHLARMAEFGGSLGAAERYAAIAAEFGGVRAAVTAEWMLGASHHLVGNQAAAQQSYEKGFSTAASVGIAEVHSFGFDHRVRALIGYARTMWLRGFPDHAARLAYQGMEVAGRQEHPVSLCICLQHATPVFLWRGDLELAESLIERLTTCASKYSLPNYEAGGMGLKGELLLARGQTQLGVNLLREALAVLRAEGRYMLSSSVYRALAEGLANAGEFTEASSVIDGLLADARNGSGTFELPDMLRTRARVLLLGSPDNLSLAEASLKESIQRARQQGALGWELRSALVLASLWVDLGLVTEARHLLAEVRERFTEGFETADLVQATRQLHDIEVKAGGS
ncbi:ATP-binding protein [Bradyrhizobium sp. STM 3557]|uniref:ATP-binding protein n=1 Tax=Bradyrhizobium sp. STM 3557 TaxID=578920 RepID=UPI003890C660